MSTEDAETDNVEDWHLVVKDRRAAGTRATDVLSSYTEEGTARKPALPDIKALATGHPSKMEFFRIATGFLGAFLIAQRSQLGHDGNGRQHNKSK